MDWKEYLDGKERLRAQYLEMELLKLKRKAEKRAKEREHRGSCPYSDMLRRMAQDAQRQAKEAA